MKISKKIVLIRHGETQANVDGISQGHKNFPLNKNGQLQAQALGAYIKGNYDFDRVVSSDLSRCTMTADALGYPYETDPMLREITTGEFEGLTFDEIQDRYPNDIHRVFVRRHGFASAPKGESWIELVARAGRFIEHSGILDGEGDVCLVSHGGTIRALIVAFLDLPVNAMDVFDMKNTGLSIVLRYDTDEGDHFSLGLLNSTEHLNSMRQT